MPEEEPVEEKAPATQEPEQTEAPAGTEAQPEGAGEEEREDLVRFNPEHHIFLEDARKIKKDAEPGDEIVFPLEARDDYGRIAAQTAKQVIIQRMREAEKISVIEEYGKKEGEIVAGTVQRIERGNIFVDLGKATGVIAYDEQIPGERYRQGERIRAYLYLVEETPRGIYLRLSRSHPKFIKKLFELEAPEIATGTVEIKAIAREAGSRSKIAVASHDEHVDPVGACVGQRGVRVSTVMSELGGEKIDIIEWSEEPEKFIEDALSPAKVLEIEVDEEHEQAIVRVAEDQLSLAIGKGGQNVRLAAKLTGWKIDIQGAAGDTVAESDGEQVEIEEEAVMRPEGAMEDVSQGEPSEEAEAAEKSSEEQPEAEGPAESEEELSEEGKDKEADKLTGEEAAERREEK